MSKSASTEMRDRVLNWEKVIRADSAMYSQIALGVAENPQLLDLLQAVRPGQLEMNMLLGAVHYLLMGERDHPLADWYPSLGGDRTGGEIIGRFTEFVEEHREAVVDLISTRLVQTNEVARCTFLLPAYNLVNRTTGLPLALIEVGTSAGLNQNVDHYGYSYISDAGRVNVSPDSPVQLASSTGARVPPLASTVPDIVWRTGLDQHAVDITDPDEARWLRALVWPDQVERQERLTAAIGVAQLRPPTVHGGDVFESLPELLHTAPSDAAVVVQHSFVLNQFARADRERFYRLLDDLAADRSVYRVGAEMLDQTRGTILELAVHGPNRWTTELAEVHHHGAWIKWHM